MQEHKVIVKDPDYLQGQLKAESLQNIADKLSLEELQKLERMCTPKGRNALKTKWNFISKFI